MNPSALLAISLLYLAGRPQPTDATTTLLPPTFNLAAGKPIHASATCGIPERELYCKLTGAVAENEHTSGSIIQGQLCDYCDSTNPAQSHPPENAVDGTESWWQSPPLSRGAEHTEVNLTIDLGQEFHVAYVFIKMANSPRPRIWSLERSTDYGQTFTPWQYFAPTSSECRNVFDVAIGLSRLVRDHQVICTKEFSSVVPLEGGEIAVSLVNRRPGARNFSHSDALQSWTRATNVRIRLLQPHTLHGHLPRHDPTVTRRYFYSIKDVSIGGRCVCNGHADSCDRVNPRKLQCRCRHNTCGDQCEKCCPGFVQKKWRPSRKGSLFECEPCQCFGHSQECDYDEEVDTRRLSLDVSGDHWGGGVCRNCQHNTAGINCDNCRRGFYRKQDVPLNSTQVCRRCNCDPKFSTGDRETCDQTDGRCMCKVNFDGPRCDRCAPGYTDYPNCVL